MGLLIDLRELAAESEKASEWQRVAKENYFDLDIKFKHKQKPAGRLSLSRVGNVSVSLIESVSQHHEREPSAFEPRSNQFFLANILRGQAVFEQNGRTKILRPGHIGVFDIDTPYECDFADDYQIIILQMSNARFRSAIAPPADYDHPVLREEQGSFVISSFLQEMAGSLDCLSDAAGTKMVGFGIDMIAKMFAVASDREIGRGPADALDGEGAIG